VRIKELTRCPGYVEYNIQYEHLTSHFREQWHRPPLMPTGLDVEALSAVLGLTIPVDAGDYEIDRMLIAVTPSLRARALFRRAGADNRMPLPSYVPQMIIGLYALAVMA